MSSRDKYTVELKPSVLDIKQAYSDYSELNNMLENSSYEDGGFFILNNNKMFDDDKWPSICQHKIILDEIQNIEILNNGKIEKSKLFLLEIEDEINLKIEIENMVYFSKSDNIFDSIVELRKKLELKNIYLLCNASVINVYPSGMQKEFGGTKAYKLQMGKQATLSDVVDIFDYDSELKIGSVKEQEEFFESWIESF